MTFFLTGFPISSIGILISFNVVENYFQPIGLVFFPGRMTSLNRSTILEPGNNESEIFTTPRSSYTTLPSDFSFFNNKPAFEQNFMGIASKMSLN